MPLTATIEDIKSYQEKVDKNEITPFNLPECSRCHSDSQSFKFHAYRERRFLIIIKMLVEAVFCALVRFRCSKCGKTFTSYPDFVIPYKHYTRKTIESFSNSYVEDDKKTYESAVTTDNGVPEYQNTGQGLAPSTIHRWITTLADLIIAYQDASTTSLQKKIFSHLIIPKNKYKTDQRKECLLRCRWFFAAGNTFKNKLHRVCNQI
jgi:hypothetical protein